MTTVVERVFIEEVIAGLWLGARRSTTEFTDGSSDARVILLHRLEDDILQYEVDASRVFVDDRAIVAYRRTVPRNAMSEDDSIMACLPMLTKADESQGRKRGRKPAVVRATTLNGAAHI